MDNSVDDIISKMPLDWRYHWCDSGACACMGCVNGSGGFRNKEQWRKWVSENPEPPRPIDNGVIYDQSN